MARGKVINFWTWQPLLEHGKYIGRPSKWGNPFIIGQDGTREQVIEKYEEWIRQQPDLLEALDELEDRILVCYCAPKPCHGDVLLKLLEERKRKIVIPKTKTTVPKSKIRAAVREVIEERKNDT